jgi:hypothetical protein
MTMLVVLDITLVVNALGAYCALIAILFWEMPKIA